MAYSGLQPGLHYFVLPDIGYIAYAVTHYLIKKHVLVLGDPVCADKNLKQLMQSFLEDVSRMKDRPVCSFWQTGEKTAVMASELGLYSTEMGIETSVDLQKLSRSATRTSTRFMRRSVQKAMRSGAKIYRLPSAPDRSDELKAVSESWVSRISLHARELSFLASSVHYTDEHGIQRWVAERNGKIVAFASFTPTYNNGEIIGYYADNLRSIDPDSDQWRSALIAEAANNWANEGLGVLGLGLSPFRPVTGPAKIRRNRFVTVLVNVLYNHCNFIYNFKGLAEHKRKYPFRTERPVYLITKRWFCAAEFLAMMKIMGMPLGSVIFRRLFRKKNKDQMASRDTK